MIGQRLGPYELLAILGEGGMGVVYRALDTKLNRPAAIKFLSDGVADAAARRRFQREAQTASSLNHPHMSPEQAVGRSLDARSDVFSFGVLIYELLAGRRPFDGENMVDVLHAITHATPRPLASETPLPLRLVVEKALEKDPADRYQSMRELVVDLRRLARRGTEELAIQAGHSAPRAEKRGGSIARWASVVAGIVLAGAAGWMLRSAIETREPGQRVHVQRLTDMGGLEEAPALSPDGKTVAFVAVAGTRRQIWIRLLAGGAPLALTKDDVDHYSPRSRIEIRPRAM